MSREKLFLIDGHSYCYRAYYAIRSLSNSRGEPTNAIYGFVTIIRKVIEAHNPEWVAICFDRPEPTFRHEKFEDYKAHRDPMPDDLADQIEAIKEFCELYGLPIFEKAGYEADDIIGTLAKQGEAKGLDVFLLTGDKDAMQLVNDRVKMMNPGKDHAIVDISGVQERYEGLGPEKVIDIMALMGDSSDNVPGVPGIGQKTAIKLIQEFGSVENLIKFASKVKSKTQQAKIKDNKEEALMSKELVTIDTEVPVKFKWDDLKYQGPDAKKLMEFFKHYEFRSQLKEFSTPASQKKKETKRTYQLIASQKDFDAFVKKLEKVKAFSFDTETTSENPVAAHLVGMSFCWEKGKAYYLPVASKKHEGTGLDLEKVLKKLEPILENPKQKKFGHNIKYDWIVLKKAGILLNGVAFDTMIASYLVNPIKLNHNLDDVSLEYLGIQKIPTAQLLGKGKQQVTMDQVPAEQVCEYACEDADCVFQLVQLLQARLAEVKSEKLFDNLEMPLLEVLAKMEMNGVYLDTDFLKKLSDQAAKDLEKLTKQIYKQAGKEFNINSPKQLSEIMFEEMELPVIKKTKTGYSTDVSVLERLAEEHEFPELILEFREKTKLKSTYLDALPSIILPETGAVHTSYHQTTTATGRLSSSDPNLQNIPIRTEAGRMVRKAFIPKPSKKKRQILSADYSQIELRILAHLTGDKSLTEAFSKDLDVHVFTATKLYGVKEKEVTREMRNVAKTINFSIIYGKTAFGLSKDLGLSIPEADGFIENYFKRYKAVKDYLESQKEKARKKGYLTTLLGRRSYFPDINSRNFQLRQFAERAAINAPIQGSAADLIKQAMLDVQTAVEEQGLDSQMIMQVHDELVFDMAKSESEELKTLVCTKMEGAFKLKVPLKVDVTIGDSWFKG